MTRFLMIGVVGGGSQSSSKSTEDFFLVFGRDLNKVNKTGGGTRRLSNTYVRSSASGAELPTPHLASSATRGTEACLTNGSDHLKRS